MHILVIFIFIATPVLAILSLFHFRWAYIVFIALSIIYFPASVAFHLNPQPCELVFGWQLGVFSLTNYQHIIRFAIFFAMTAAQFRVHDRRTFIWSFVVVLIMGAIVELGEAVSGKGHCRSRDLIPDVAGGLI